MVLPLAVAAGYSAEPLVSSCAATVSRDAVFRAAVGGDYAVQAVIGDGEFRGWLLFQRGDARGLLADRTLVTGICGVPAARQLKMGDDVCCDRPVRDGVQLNVVMGGQEKVVRVKVGKAGQSR